MHISHALARLSLMLLTGSALAQADRKEIGTLTCTTEDMIATPPDTVRPMQCSFEPIAKGSAVSFTGKIHKFVTDGLPPGRQVLVWSVLSTNAKLAGEALEGQYTNEGQAPIPNVGQMLVGGTQGQVALQPHTQDAEVGVSSVKTVVELELAPIKT
ncbi:DUF992 domain-containing protein [Leptospira interrogans]